MDKIVIWGTGGGGEKAYYKLRKTYDIIGYADSNEKRWGATFCGKKIWSYDDLAGEQQYKLVIASEYYREILRTIENLGLDVPVIRISINSGLLVSIGNEMVYKCRKKVRRILYVQSSEDIRTYKIAKTMSEQGIRVDLAYTHRCIEQDIKGESPYEHIISINDMQQFIDYVNAEDYDVIHCSNEPDALTNLLIFNCNKKVIHDLHDMKSHKNDLSIDEMVMEYNAMCHAAGLMYVTEQVKEIANQKYNLTGKPTLVVDNYILKEICPRTYLPKLSHTDQEIHCVYEGGVWEDEHTHRYLEDIFLRIASEGIHVHFYPTGNNKYYSELGNKSPYIHYEGFVEYEQLITEMTKYDIGLLYLNVTKENRDFLTATSPNKIYEYACAGLPVAVCDIETLVKRVHELQIGEELQLEGNIKEQMEDMLKIRIDKGFLVEHGLTMEDHGERILAFYEEVLNRNG